MGSTGGLSGLSGSVPPWFPPSPVFPPELLPPGTIKLFMLVSFPAKSLAITSMSYLVLFFRSVHVNRPVSFVSSFLFVVPVSVMAYLYVTFPLYFELPDRLSVAKTFIVKPVSLTSLLSIPVSNFGPSLSIFIVFSIRFDSFPALSTVFTLTVVIPI